MKKRMAIFLICFMLVDPITAEAKDSEEYIEIIEDVAEDYSICPELIQALMERESNATATAERAGCVGLLQINRNVHKKRMKALGVTDLKDPEQNIKVGCDLLDDLFDMYEDPAMVLDAYHGNLKSMSFYESGKITKYAQGILNRSEELERLHGK